MGAETDDDWDWKHEDVDHPTIGPDELDGESGGAKGVEPIGNAHDYTLYEHGGNGNGEHQGPATPDI